MSTATLIVVILLGGIVSWVTVFVAFYVAFTTTYLLAAIGWQAWKKGKAVWKRI